MSVEGKLVRQLFRKYKLDVHETEENREYLSPNNLLPGEIGCKEIRVSLGYTCTLEWMKDWHGYDNLVDFDKEYNEKVAEKKEQAKGIKDLKVSKNWLKPTLETLKKDRDRFINDLELSINNQTREGESCWMFSIFLRDHDRHLSVKKEADLLYIYDAAYHYMSFLVSCCPDVYKQYCEDIFKEDLDTFKNILEFLDIQITNENLDRIWELSYRFYRDSKFFYELRDFMHDGTYDQFIRDFEYIVSNDPEDIDFEEDVLNNIVE